LEDGFGDFRFRGFDRINRIYRIGVEVNGFVRRIPMEINSGKGYWVVKL